MSTSSWSFIAGGALILFALATLGVGYFLNRPSKKETPQDENEEA